MGNTLWAPVDHGNACAPPSHPKPHACSRPELEFLRPLLADKGVKVTDSDYEPSMPMNAYESCVLEEAKEEMRKRGYVLGRLISLHHDCAVIRAMSRTGADVAIKISLYEDDLPGQEAESLSVLSAHPNTQEALEIFAFPHIRCEVVVSQFLRAQPIHPKEDEREYLRGLMRAIQHCHAHTIIHRDIKPDNVIWTDGRAVLIDFDCSKYCGDGPMTAKSHCGTDGFFAPEISEADDVEYGTGVDVYSAGITWANAWMGGVLERQIYDDDLQIILPILRERNIMTDLCDLLEGMLEEDPEKRLTTQQVLDSPLLQ